jgi:hypothetical protein
MAAMKKEVDMKQSPLNEIKRKEDYFKNVCSKHNHCCWDSMTTQMLFLLEAFFNLVMSCQTMFSYVKSCLILSCFIILVCPSVGLPSTLRLGAIFDHEDQTQELAFKYAIR